MSRAIEVLALGIEKTFGRDLLWKLGRVFYFTARREGANDIDHNGERLVQRLALARAKARGETAIVFDVGANYGQWAGALLAEAKAMDAAVDLTSFEPVPEINASLTRHLGERSGPRQIARAVQLAAADASGTLRFSVTEIGAGTHHLYKSGDEADHEVIDVEVVALDRYFEEHGIAFVDLLKIDCEGHDAAVIAGARASLAARRVAIVQFEYNQRWIDSRSFLKDIWDLAETVGYRFGRVVPAGIELYANWSHELERFIESNYALVDPAVIEGDKFIPLRFGPSNTPVRA